MECVIHDKMLRISFQAILSVRFRSKRSKSPFKSNEVLFMYLTLASRIYEPLLAKSNLVDKSVGYVLLKMRATYLTNSWDFQGKEMYLGKVWWQK